MAGQWAVGTDDLQADWSVVQSIDGKDAVKELRLVDKMVFHMVDEMVCAAEFWWVVNLGELWDIEQVAKLETLAAEMKACTKLKIRKQFHIKYNIV